MKKAEDYIESRSARLKEWREKIARMKEIAEEEDVDTSLQAQVASLEKRERAVRGMLESLREVGSESRRQMKSGVEQAWRQLQDSIRQASRHFSN